MNLDVTKEDLSILEELLTKEITELPVEIHHTFHREFKDHLKDKQNKVEDLLERVKKLH
jgi:hypothetical protein